MTEARDVRRDDEVTGTSVSSVPRCVPWPEEGGGSENIGEGSFSFVVPSKRGGEVREKGTEEEGRKRGHWVREGRAPGGEMETS